MVFGIKFPLFVKNWVCGKKFRIVMFFFFFFVRKRFVNFYIFAYVHYCHSGETMRLELNDSNYICFLITLLLYFLFYRILNNVVNCGCYHWVTFGLTLDIHCRSSVSLYYSNGGWPPISCISCQYCIYTGTELKLKI